MSLCRGEEGIRVLILFEIRLPMGFLLTEGIYLGGEERLGFVMKACVHLSLSIIYNGFSHVADAATLLFLRIKVRCGVKVTGPVRFVIS